MPTGYSNDSDTMVAGQAADWNGN